MCGIAGILTIKPIKSHRQIKNMLRTLKHRGPDGTAYKSIKNAQLGVVRLSMNDIDSPTVIFENQEHDLLCTFNGEIYNYNELKKLLPNKGSELQTKNDGEIILHLYQKYGKSFIKLLNGMFTIVITDGDRLLLYSDYFGIKPLYYSMLSDGTFMFSSEIRPLLKQLPKQTISDKGLASYLQYRFVAHPFTIFSDIYKISPHQILEINNQKVRKFSYKPIIKPQKTLQQWVKNIKNYDSDEVDIGYFLSGGLDSSILVTLSAKQSHTFTIRYPGIENGDEVNYAKQVANLKSHKHHVCPMQDKLVPSIVTKAIFSLEEPLYSTVAPSTYFLASCAKHFVRGVISGDGSDELFIGYHYIRTALSNINDEINTYKSQIGWLDSDIARNIFIQQPRNINLIKENISPLKTIMDFERNYRLPSYHLFRLDKMTMANSIEARVPFLSNEILGFLDCRSLDSLYTTQPKEILIKTFQKCLPREIVARKKQPFPSPFIHWIDTCLYKDIQKTFNNRKLCTKVNLKSHELGTLLAGNNKTYSEYTAIWGTYALLKWLKYYKRYIC